MDRTNLQLGAFLGISVLICVSLFAFVLFQPAHRRNIVCYSDGVKIGKWVSEGRVRTALFTKEIWFRDNTTGQRVTVMGDCIVTQQPKE